MAKCRTFLKNLRCQISWYHMVQPTFINDSSQQSHTAGWCMNLPQRLSHTDPVIGRDRYHILKEIKSRDSPRTCPEKYSNKLPLLHLSSLPSINRSWPYCILSTQNLWINPPSRTISPDPPKRFCQFCSFRAPKTSPKHPQMPNAKEISSTSQSNALQKSQGTSQYQATASCEAACVKNACQACWTSVTTSAGNSTLSRLWS